MKCNRLTLKRVGAMLVSLCAGFALMAQTTVTGTVTSSVEGEGSIPGVSVVVKGTTTGTAVSLRPGTPQAISNEEKGI